MTQIEQFAAKKSEANLSALVARMVETKEGIAQVNALQNAATKFRYIESAVIKALTPEERHRIDELSSDLSSLMGKAAARLSAHETDLQLEVYVREGQISLLKEGK